jgi:large subunit ribosomal protein L24
MHVKKDDLVEVTTGDDKKKQGKVIEACPRENKIRVQGVGLVKRHYKARKQGESSEIKEKERFIDASNVRLVE